MPVIVISLFLMLFGSIAAFADEVKLEPRTERKVWSRSDGEVVKDFEWKVSGTVSTSETALTVRISEEVTKHADKFAGVIGEMDFADDALRSTEVKFADGTSQSADSSVVTVQGAAANQAVTDITVHFELVGAKWTVAWSGTDLRPPGAVLPSDWPTTTTDQAPAAPAGSQATKGTWLTPTVIKDRPQDLGGVWKTSTPAADGSTVRLFEQHGADLAGVSLPKTPGWYFKLSNGGSDRWTGSGAAPGADGNGFWTCPIPKNTCPQLCKWSAGYLDIPPGALEIKGEWREKQIDTTKCTFTSDPNIGPEEFTRFVGVSFDAIRSGKYIFMAMAPAVGNQPAQFKAVVKLVTAYAGLDAKDVRYSVAPQTGAMLSRSGGDAFAGTYEFSTTGHGTYELAFDVIGKDDSVIHTDRVRIEIPSVPGIGN
jgi:hypothetical protein